VTQNTASEGPRVSDRHLRSAPPRQWLERNAELGQQLEPVEMEALANEPAALEEEYVAHRVLDGSEGRWKTPKGSAVSSSESRFYHDRIITVVHAMMVDVHVGERAMSPFEKRRDSASAVVDLAGRHDLVPR
jgi:hypothetical protein